MIYILDTERKPFLKLPDTFLKDKYFFIDPEGNVCKYIGNNLEVESIGGGGFGVVSRIMEKAGFHRVIKFIKFTSHDFMEDSFKQELQLSNQAPFNNVVPIVEYGISEDTQGVKFGYCISQFVRGITLGRIFQAVKKYPNDILSKVILKDNLHDMTLKIFRDVLSAIEELSNENIVHMDVKPANIIIYGSELISTDDKKNNIAENVDRVIKSGSKLKAFLIDLGAGKPIKNVQEYKENERTFFLRTERYFPEHLNKELGYEKENEMHYINSKKLAMHWRKIDMYCYGRTLETVLVNLKKTDLNAKYIDRLDEKEENKKELFWRHIFGENYKVLTGIIKKLKYFEYTNIFDALSELKSIPLKNDRDVFTSEIFTDRYPGRRIRTSMGMIRIGAPYEPIIDHKAFQRLRKVQQLAMVSEIFPDGTHTRFAHSIRTYNLAKLFVGGLNRKTEFRLIVGKKDVETILAAALLHDIGQYHFSHSLEDLRKMGERINDSRLKMIKHDQELTLRYLNDTDRSGKNIGNILDDMGVSLDDIFYIIQKSEKQKDKGTVLNISRDIVSGVIDVDRVSYLLHDSQHTGVTYGQGVDIGSLIESLTINLQSEIPSLAIDEGGISAAESVLTATYWMYQRIYWNHHNRAFMAALKYVMQKLLLNDVITFDDYLDNIYCKSDWDALNYLNEQFKSNNNGEYNPLDNLVSLRRLGYKRVFSFGYDLKNSQTRNVYEKISKGLTPNNEESLINAIIGRLPKRTRVLPGQILIDVPLKQRFSDIDDYENYTEKTAERGAKSAQMDFTVLKKSKVSKRDVGYENFYNLSPLAGKLSAIEKLNGKKIRIYFAKELINDIGEDNANTIEESLYKILEDQSSDWIIKK
jgi:HD superfamily phosphohydrolase